MDARSETEVLLPYISDHIFYQVLFPLLDEKTLVKIRQVGVAFNRLATKYLFEHAKRFSYLHPRLWLNRSMLCLNIEKASLLEFLRQPQCPLDMELLAFQFAAAKSNIKLQVDLEKRALILAELDEGSSMDYSVMTLILRPFLHSLTHEEKLALSSQLFAKFHAGSKSSGRIQVGISLLYSLTDNDFREGMRVCAYENLKNSSSPAQLKNLLPLILEMIVNFSLQQRSFAVEFLIAQLFTVLTEIPESDSVIATALNVISIAIREMNSLQIEQHLQSVLSKLAHKKSSVRSMAQKVLERLAARFDAPQTTSVLNFLLELFTTAKYSYIAFQVNPLASAQQGFLAFPLQIIDAMTKNFTAAQMKVVLDTAFTALRITIMHHAATEPDLVITKAEQIAKIIKLLAPKFTVEEAAYVFLQLQTLLATTDWDLRNIVFTILIAIAPRMGRKTTSQSLALLLSEIEKSTIKTFNDGYALKKESLRGKAVNALSLSYLTPDEISQVFQFILAKLKSSADYDYVQGVKLIEVMAEKFTYAQNEALLEQISLKLNDVDQHAEQVSCLILPFLLAQLDKKPHASALLIDLLLPRLFEINFTSQTSWKILAPHLTKHIDFILKKGCENLNANADISLRDNVLGIINALLPEFNITQREFVFNQLIILGMASDQEVYRKQAVRLIKTMRTHLTCMQSRIIITKALQPTQTPDSYINVQCLKILYILSDHLNAKDIKQIFNLADGILSKDGITDPILYATLEIIANFNINFNEKHSLSLVAKILLKLDHADMSIRIKAMQALNHLVGKLSKEQCKIVIDSVLKQLGPKQSSLTHLSLELLIHLIVTDKCDLEQLQKTELNNNAYIGLIQSMAQWYLQIKNAVPTSAAIPAIISHGLFAPLQRIEIAKPETHDLSTYNNN